MNLIQHLNKTFCNTELFKNTDILKINVKVVSTVSPLGDSLCVCKHCLSENQLFIVIPSKDGGNHKSHMKKHTVRSGKFNEDFFKNNYLKNWNVL